MALINGRVTSHGRICGYAAIRKRRLCVLGIRAVYVRGELVGTFARAKVLA